MTTGGARVAATVIARGRPSSREIANRRRVLYLRISCWIAAAFELLAVVPMLSPPLFGKVMGLGNFRPGSDYTYAMDIAAVFTAGWIALLLWASRRPIERRGVLLLTIFVFLGNALCGVYAATSGLIPTSTMVPSWIVQMVIVLLFGLGYYMAQGSRSPQPVTN